MKLVKISRIIAAILLPALLVTIIPAAPAKAAISITLSSNQAARGQEITINGSGFYGSTANETNSRGVNILFGKSPGTQMDYEANIYQKVQIAELRNGSFQTKFRVPSRLDGGLVKEEVTRGTYYVYFTYYHPPLPGGLPGDALPILQIITFKVVVGTITISPDNGPVGTEVSINGNYFGANENILSAWYDSRSIDITGATTTDSSGVFGVTKITIPPSAAGQHTIAISGNASGSRAEAKFTVTPKLNITPTSGAAGIMLVVAGIGFGAQLEVTTTFGGEAVPTVVTTATGSFPITFSTEGKTPGSYSIVSRDANGNSAEASFLITVTSLNLSPTSGKEGTGVAINGGNFLPNRPITITFNDTKIATASTDEQGNFNTTFTVPALASGTYKVKASDGKNTHESDFDITANADINPKTSLDSPGHVGSQLTITGEGFTAGSTVTISYEAEQVATATVKADKSFSATLKAPASSAGEHTVIATDDTNRSKPFTFYFYMEKDPPATPVPLKPEMNIKAKAKTYFDWEDIADDPSGVTYTLQVATDEEFSDIALEKTGLTESEYTLTVDQKLEATEKEALYYWHVRAVDGAGNQSPWSGTGAFTVAGLLALSPPVSYILIGIGILALAIFAFWLGRKTAYY